MTQEIMNPTAFIVPKVASTTVKYTMVPEVGTLVFDQTLDKLSICVTSVVGSAAWETITSVAE